MRIEWDGKTYEYDPSKIDVTTAMVIRERSGGWGLRTWAQHVDDWDPLAAQLLLWAVKRQAGEPCNPVELEFEVSKFMDAVTEAAVADMAEKIAESEVPSVPKARTRKKTPISAKPETSTSSVSPT